MVYLDDGLTMVKRANRGNQLNIRFGADDRVFLLRRTDMKDCAAVEEAVTAPVTWRAATVTSRPGTRAGRPVIPPTRHGFGRTTRQ